MAGLWTRPATAIPRPDLQGPLMMTNRRLRGCIGHRIFVPVLVDKRLDNFDKVASTEMNKLPPDSRAKSAPRRRVDLALTNDSYVCEGHGLELPIAWEDRTDRPNIDHDKFAAQSIIEWLVMNFESTVAAQCASEAVWTASGTTGKTVSTAWDVAGGTAYADVQAGKDQLCNANNCNPDDLLLVLSRHTFDYLPIMTDYKSRMHASTQTFPGQATIEQAKAYFGVGDVAVGSGNYNSANVGAAEVNARLWPNTHAFLCLPAKPGDPVNRPQLGRTFVWPGFGEMAAMIKDGGQPESGYDGLPVALGSYVDDKHSADVVCGDTWYHVKRFDTRFGYVFKSVGT